MLDEKDVPKIVVDKGFELARSLLSPDTFYSISELQKEKKYGNLIFDIKKQNLTLKTNSGVRNIEPHKIIEQGVAVCKTKDGDIFFEQGGKRGISMEIRPDMCGQRGEYIGSLHTHPGGSPIPSIGDLGASTHNKDRFMCIAARTARDKLAVNCYIPKQEFLPEEINILESQQREKIMRWTENQLRIIIKDENYDSGLTNFKKRLDAKDRGALMLKAQLEKDGLTVDDFGLTTIPVQDQDRIKWYASSLLDGVGEYFEIKKFERQI